MSKGQKQKKNVGCYSPEFRRELVMLYLEEGYSIVMLSEEFGCGKSTIGKWVKQYNEFGEDGLQNHFTNKKKSDKTVNTALKSQIIELKKADKSRGVRRISDILKRFFLLKTSPETVRKTLHEEKLIDLPPKKRRKNISKPRFFERATPNQMWQTDICTFRLAGKNAYLLGFIDDYSRYIVGMGLYRSQTAANLLEVYRTAYGEYGVPKEMLTDNGRQYTNWRGTTNFEKELHKDRIKHIKSSPHHPMTLGKIERFWKTIQQEFLFRVQFDSFENARERLALWIKYYNYKRPHQGIGGMCPADRFFEVQSELKHTLEKGIEENTLELALRGKPQRPFYMVGRLGEQNVAIRAEKGKIKMHVDDPEQIEGKELVYDLNQENSNHESESSSRAAESEPEETTTSQAEYLSLGKMSCGVISVDGKLFDQRDLPELVSDPDTGHALAGNRDGGNAFGIRPAAAQSEEITAAETSGEVVEGTENPIPAAGGTFSAGGGELEEDLSDVNSQAAVPESPSQPRRPMPGRTHFKGKKPRMHGYRCRR